MATPLLYMRLKGQSFEGEEPIGDDQKLIRIGSYSHSLGMPVSSARPSAGENVNLRRGPCQHGTFTVTRGFDKVSSKLFDAAAAGVVFEDALIFLCSMMGGSKNESHGLDSLLTIHLTNAIMTSFQYSYSGDWPIEVIGFSYTSIFWDVSWPDPVDGKVNDMEQAGWDGLLNKSGTLAIPGSLDFEDAT